MNYACANRRFFCGTCKIDSLIQSVVLKPFRLKKNQDDGQKITLKHVFKIDNQLSFYCSTCTSS